MKPFNFILTISLLWISSSGISLAQDNNNCINTQDGDKNCINKSDLLGALNLTAPSSPLFTLNGSTPQNVITPKPGDDLVLSFLPQAINTLNEENTAIAFEVNPGLLILPEYLSVKNLEKGGDLYLAKILSQFNLSSSLEKVSNDNENFTRWGLGASYTYDTKSALINNREYRECVSDFESLIVNVADTAGVRFLKISEILETNNINSVSNGRTLAVEVDQISEPNSDKIIAVLRGRKVADKLLRPVAESLLGVLNGNKSNLKSYQSGIKACGEQVSKWNRDIYGFGAAIYHIDRDDIGSMMAVETPELENDGYGFWGSAAFQSNLLSGDGQFIVSGRYLNNHVRERKIDDDNTVTENVDTLGVGARYTHEFQKPKSGNRRAVRGFIEAGYYEEDFANITDEYWQAGIGAEFQIREDLFFQTIVGDTFGSEIDRSTYLSGQVKWSFSSAATE